MKGEGERREPRREFRFFNDEARRGGPRCFPIPRGSRPRPRLHRAGDWSIAVGSKGTVTPRPSVGNRIYADEQVTEEPEVAQVGDSEQELAEGQEQVLQDEDYYDEFDEI
eukprot:XP_020395382.1 uncharacterized protein LOC109939319 [Zea mays]